MWRRPRILDCGANVGLASLFFKRRCPSARITAYEADPALFKILAPISTPTAPRTWKPSTRLCGRRTDACTFRADGSDSGMIGTLSGAVGGTAVDVPSLRLRDLIERDANGRIDLLKLDIEGAEDAVLADCEPVLHRVGAIVLDLHEFDPCRSPGATRARVADPQRVHLRRGRVRAAAMASARLAAEQRRFPAKALVWSMTVRAWRQ